MQSGNNIDESIVDDPVIFMLEGWWRVAHKSTEYLIIKTFIKPRIDIPVQIFNDVSAFLTNL